MNKITKDSKITLVELPPWQFGILNGEPSYDEYSLFRLPSRAIHSLEAVLREDGWKDVQSINPLYHGINGKLSEENLRRIVQSDFLLLSYITRTAYQTYQLAKIARETNPKIRIVLGGYHASAMPLEALEFGDVVVVGEGEKTLRELMNALAKDRYEIDYVKGLAFNRDRKVVFTPPRELMNKEELSGLPHPYYDEATKKGIDSNVIETTRGCPNKCKFCSVWKFFGNKYRTKSVEYIIEGLKRIKGIKKSVFITDDNFTANPEFVDRLSYEIKKEGLNDFSFTVQADDRGSEPRRIKALKRMGVKSVCEGFESNNDETLEDLGKPFNAGQNKEAAIRYREAGLWVHGMLILSLKETPDTIRELLRFACKYTDSAQFFPLFPLPETEAREEYERKGIILSNEWYLYDGHHVLLKTDKMTPYEMQIADEWLYKEYYSPRHCLERFGRSPNKYSSLVIAAYTNLFHGISRVSKSRQYIKHLRYLKSIS